MREVERRTRRARAPPEEPGGGTTDEVGEVVCALRDLGVAVDLRARMHEKIAILDDRKAHAVVYMTGARPTGLQDEHLMDKEPIAVDPVSADQRLNNWSRLDFRRVYTVEHNVKVKDIGRVSRQSMPYLTTYFG